MKLDVHAPLRIDRYLSALEIFSRKQSRPLLKKGFFSVNGTPVKDPGHMLHEGDTITRDDQTLIAKRNILMRIYKPVGYVSSDVGEAGYPSYRELLGAYPYMALLHVAGRLDVDTEGLLIATSDGTLLHRLISPKHHVRKTYLVTTRDTVSNKDRVRLVKGITIDDGTTTLPAKCTIIDPHTLHLTLREGKFHQVKRMLLALGNEVTHLKRETFGDWTLEGLEKGGWEEMNAN